MSMWNRSSVSTGTGHTTGQAYRFGVRRPVRGGHEHLVTGVAQRRERLEHRLLGPVGDEDLRCAHLVSRIPGGLERDLLPELWKACGRGVVVVGGVPAGLDRRLDDVGGRGEVGLPRAEPDHVVAGTAKCLRPGVDGQGGRRRHRADPRRDAAVDSRRFEPGNHACHACTRDSAHRNPTEPGPGLPRADRPARHP